jgi:hypothetical protein
MPVIMLTARGEVLRHTRALRENLKPEAAGSHRFNPT